MSTRTTADRPRPSVEPTIDLAELERRLHERAWWYDDPAAYRQGVRDVLDAVAVHPATRDVGAREAAAG